MNRNQLSILLIVTATVLLSFLILFLQDDHDHTSGGHGHGHGGHDDHAEEMPRGPHGGRMLEKDGFNLEMTIFESGVPPEFHIYPYLDGKPLAAKDVQLNIKLHRTGNKTDDISLYIGRGRTFGNDEDVVILAVGCDRIIA